MTEQNIEIVLVLSFLVVIAVLFIIGIIVYIFNAIGLFKLAKREGKSDIAWLGWVPIGNTILMMQMLEGAVHKSFRGKLTLIYGISLGAGLVVTGIFQFFGILAILLLPPLLLLQLATAFIYFYAFYFLANRYSTNPILHLVIGIITFGLSIGISIFMLRNKEVVDSTGLITPEYQEIT